jgi:hypothetical protein
MTKQTNQGQTDYRRFNSGRISYRNPVRQLARQLVEYLVLTFNSLLKCLPWTAHQTANHGWLFLTAMAENFHQKTSCEQSFLLQPSNLPLFWTQVDFKARNYCSVYCLIIPLALLTYAWHSVMGGGGGGKSSAVSVVLEPWDRNGTTRACNLGRWLVIFIRWCARACSVYT